MDLLVQDIIKLYPLSRARLLAGKSGLMRTVASANIQEVPNVERWLRRGEVLGIAGIAARCCSRPDMPSVSWRIWARSWSASSAQACRPSLSSPGSICRRSPRK